MKKRIASLFLVLAMALTLLPTAVMAEESTPAYSGGTGTEEDPWLISTVADLKTLAATVNSGAAAEFDADCEDAGNYHGYYFKQTADLDLSSIENWGPIGYSGSGRYFAGNYDGDNHIISNATSSGMKDSDGFATVGIFGWVAFGSVSNLHVRNVNFTATGKNNRSYAGGLLAVAYQCTVENCSVFDSFVESRRDPNNSNFAGGIAGIVGVPSTFKMCASERNDIKTMDYGGGFVGSSDFDATVTAINCYVADCSIVGSSTTPQIATNIGAFLGASQENDANLTNCFIYNCTVQAGADTLAASNTGLFTGNTYYGKVNAVNSYYYDSNSLTVNADAAKSRTKDEFADPTMVETLGDAFVQGKDHPVLNIPVTGIVLDKEELFLTIGDEETLTVAVLPTVAVNQEITWESSDDTVATVDETGKVTAIAAGTVTITVTTADGGKTATCTVTVSAPAPTPTPRPSRPSSPSYGVSAPATDNGTVSVSPKNASAGTTVTVTVKPDSGYVLGGLRVTDKDGDDVKLTDQGNGKYTFTMPAGGAVVTAGFVKETKDNPFTDVPDGAYYYDAVLWAAENGVTDGVTATLFAPDAPCTRAQIVTFLWRAAGSPEPVGTSAFTDVPASAYYAKAVAWAVENGITTGTSDTTFSPDAPCTRGQSVTFLYRARKGAASASANFTDVPAGAYYAAPVAWAVENGITNGTGKTTFSPDAPCTRAEIVTFLYRAK